MLKSVEEVPDCTYSSGEPGVRIRPSAPTPHHTLYLSNLDDQNFLRFSIKYLYIFQKSVCLERLKSSLSRVLVDYYPLAGRLRNTSSLDDHHKNKLEVDCNGEGAVFAEAFMATTAQQLLLLHSSNTPNKSWKNKFLFKLHPHTFLHVPPLLIQVTNLLCGGMVLCTAINHCLCDGIGTSQFLQAWAQLTKNPQSDLTILPFHVRHVLKPREPPQVKFPHPGYTRSPPNPQPQVDLHKFVQSQPLIPTSFTFGHSHVLRLKKQCVPFFKCTAFEAIAVHTWRSWVRSLHLPPTLVVKLLFSVNVRKKVDLPEGYYGNGFLLGCAESTVEELVDANLHHGVKLVQKAKATVNDEEYVRSTVDLLEDKAVKTDLSCSLVISQWSKLGLEEIDFGEGRPLHMGPLTSDIYCLFLPVIGHADAVRVLLSVPQSVLECFQYNMMMLNEILENEENNGDVKIGIHA